MTKLFPIAIERFFLHERNKWSIYTYYTHIPNTSGIVTHTVSNSDSVTLSARLKSVYQGLIYCILYRKTS